jgi:hypothetical protein
MTAPRCFLFLFFDEAQTNKTKPKETSYGARGDSHGDSLGIQEAYDRIASTRRGGDSAERTSEDDGVGESANTHASTPGQLTHRPILPPADTHTHTHKHTHAQARRRPRSVRRARRHGRSERERCVTGGKRTAPQAVVLDANGNNSNDGATAFCAGNAVDRVSAAAAAADPSVQQIR